MLIYKKPQTGGKAPNTTKVEGGTITDTRNKYSKYLSSVAATLNNGMGHTLGTLNDDNVTWKNYLGHTGDFVGGIFSGIPEIASGAIDYFTEGTVSYNPDKGKKVTAGNTALGEGTEEIIARPGQVAGSTYVKLGNKKYTTPKKGMIYDLHKRTAQRIQNDVVTSGKDLIKARTPEAVKDAIKTGKKGVVNLIKNKAAHMPTGRISAAKRATKLAKMARYAPLIGAVVDEGVGQYTIATNTDDENKADDKISRYNAGILKKKLYPYLRPITKPISDMIINKPDEYEYEDPNDHTKTVTRKNK